LTRRFVNSKNVAIRRKPNDWKIYEARQSKMKVLRVSSSGEKRLASITNYDANDDSWCKFPAGDVTRSGKVIHDGIKRIENKIAALEINERA
jgi:hypothetical protein